MVEWWKAETELFCTNGELFSELNWHFIKQNVGEERGNCQWIVNTETRNRIKKTIEFNANNSFQITNKRDFQKEILVCLLCLSLFFNPFRSANQTAFDNFFVTTLFVTNHNSNWLKWNSDKFNRKIFCSIRDFWFLMQFHFSMVKQNASRFVLSTKWKLNIHRFIVWIYAEINAKGHINHYHRKDFASAKKKNLIKSNENLPLINSRLVCDPQHIADSVFCHPKSA